MFLCVFYLFSKDKTVATTGDLIEHLNSDHGHDLKTETWTFQCWEDFTKWKVAEERTSKCWFVKQRADRKTMHHKTSWFYCNRTGKFLSKGEGKRKLKSQGSSKTGCSCPAFITTRTDEATGEVAAQCCLQHVGHKKEIAFSRISMEMRSCIARKLAQGVSMNSILDYIRDNQIGPRTRDHLTTRADLRNIQREYNINYKQKDCDDASDVLYWVEEMQREDCNPVLCEENNKELEDLKRSAMAAIAELSDVLQSAPSKDAIYTALHHIRSATAVARGQQ